MRGAFLNATWGWPSIAGVNLPDGGPAYPLAAPGARLAFNPNDQLGLLIGVYSGDPAEDCRRELPQVCNPHGLDFNFSSPLLMAEMGIRYNQGEGELAGTLKLGGGSCTARSSSRRPATPGCRSACSRSPASSMSTIARSTSCSTR